MYTNRQTQVIDRQESTATAATNTYEREYAEKRRVANSNIKSNFDRIVNYENYLASSPVGSASSTTMDAPRTTTKKKTYMSPTAEFVPVDFYSRQQVFAPTEKVYSEEDITPSSTTMQFGLKENADIYEEVHLKNESQTDKNYKINSKGKVLIAVYALVVATIFSLILLNSRMLKNLDNSIDAYTARITQLSQEYDQLQGQLDYVSSDAVIEQKAAEMGYVKG